MEHEKRDTTNFAIWSQKRINLERAIQAGRDDDAIPISGFIHLLERAHLLDYMLTQAPRRAIMYGKEAETLESLKLVEDIIWEIKTGVDIAPWVEVND